MWAVCISLNLGQFKQESLKKDFKISYQIEKSTYQYYSVIFRNAYLSNQKLIQWNEYVMLPVLQGKVKAENYFWHQFIRFWWVNKSFWHKKRKSTIINENEQYRKFKKSFFFLYVCLFIHASIWCLQLKRVKSQYPRSIFSELFPYFCNCICNRNEMVQYNNNIFR